MKPTTERWPAALRWMWHSPQWLLQGLVRAYRFFLSPWLGSACRFTPTCSAYSLKALERHGAVGGSVLTTWRLLRCHPWCAGGHDPVPDHHPAHGLFTRWTTTDRSAGQPTDSDLNRKHP